MDKSSYKYPYLLRNLEITNCNQVWVIVLTYIPSARGYMYLNAIMTLKSRCLVARSLSYTIETDWVVATM